MPAELKSVKGTKDILPSESHRWQFIENSIHMVMKRYGYSEIRTPVFEETALFARGIGEDTDIVGKEMYTFLDKGGTSITLRPEMTAPVMRAFLQHSLAEQSKVSKVYYLGPMFRQERPQAGRLRQFHQFGAECIGSRDPAADAEVIAIAAQIYQTLGISSTLKINSIGDAESRTRYRALLMEFLQSMEQQLSEDSRKRIQKNPLRVLDSKSEQDQLATRNAPVILDYLTPAADEYFKQVLSLLDSVGMGYQIDPRLVRGLDYYTHTAFEFISAELGAQDALGGGGRYDGLAEQLGGKPLPGVGFAAGMERLLIVLEKDNFQFPADNPEIYLIGLHADSRAWVFKLAILLRRMGINADLDLAGRSLKSQMREANRSNVRLVVICGEEEYRVQQAIVKDMHSGVQWDIHFSDVEKKIGALLRGGMQADATTN